jgi:DNA-binding MarR family transcriptional regulator
VPRSTRPASDADLDRIVAVFDGLMHRLMANHAPELNLIDLSMSQTKALYLLLAAGELRMSELASRLGITSSSATGVVDGLVAHGLLVRHEDPADRRQVVVTATPEAEATLERFRELNSRRMREMLARVDPADLPIIERALHILDSAVTEDQAATTIDPQGDPS